MEQHISPTHLLTPQRLDICAKHVYARLREQNPSAQWGRKVYESHILAMNQGIEFRHGKVEKSGISEFVTNYETLLNSIKKHGFDDTKAVPITHNRTAMNGAHRIAACLLYNTPLTCQVLDTQERYDSSWGFFQKRGLDPDILDYMALEYCRLKSDCYLAVVYPCASAKIETIQSMLTEAGKIICRKKIPALGMRMAVNTIRHLYPDIFWDGTHKEKFPGTRSKVKNCFTGERSFYVILFEVKNHEDVVPVKENIRDFIGMGKESLHITDDHAETICMAKTFFNANSIHFLAHATPIDSPAFNERFFRYAAAINDRGVSERFAIHGSSVMEVYGVRVANDLDYISASGEALNTNDVGISMSNEKAQYADCSLAELLDDPRLYFYFYGIKFVSLPVLINMKRLRRERKDRRDLGLIRRWHKMNLMYEFIQLAHYWQRFFPRYKRKMVKRKIKTFLRTLK